MTIYEKAVSTLPASDIDHHASDLYLKYSAESSALVAGYEFKSQVSVFVSPLDHCKWFEIPFAFLPYWSEKCKGV